MPVVPGTTVEVVFQSFTGSFPDLYYGAQGGKLKLASVNAGNSNSGGLCVGLQGVNGGFLRLLSATQKRANLTPLSPGQKQGELPNSCQAGLDDYQDRHLNLLAQADGGGQAWESYSNTDPCAFSLVNSKRISKASGFEEGVCFVDVFDAKLRPHGNALNVAMLYAAPPYDGNYTSKAAFLVAIEEMAEQIIRTVSQYNALAPQQKLPQIEALRNTLYSSGFYNSHLKASQEEIARAIFKGFTSQLNLDTNTGLVELQFPVGDSANQQDPLFAAVQQDLAQGANQAHPMLQRIGGGVGPGAGVEMGDMAEGDDADLDLEQSRVDIDPNGEDTTYYYDGNRNQINDAADKLRSATKGLDWVLKHKGTLPAGIERLDSEESDDDLTGPVRPRAPYGKVEVYEPLGASPLAGVRSIARTGKNFIDSAKLGRTAGDLRTARRNVDNARDQANLVRQQADNYHDLYANSLVPAEANAAKAVKAFADAVGDYARDLDSRLRTAERLSKSFYRDPMGKFHLKRVLGGSAIGLTVSIAGVLTYVFGFGGARVASGHPDPENLDVGALDDGNPVDVDVVTLSNLTAQFQLTAQLVNNTPGDGWSVSSTDSTHLVYAPPRKPKSGSTAQATYQLVYGDNSVSATATVTITFVDPAAVLVAPATTVNKVTSATFSNLPPQFVFPAQAGWVVDPTGTSITYTVPAMTAPGGVDLTKTAAVSANYSSGNNLPGNSSTLVVLFPPADVTLVMPSRTAATSSDYLPSPGTTGATWALVDTSMSPAAYSQSLPAKDASGNPIGTWDVVTDSMGSKIRFTPTNLPAGASAPTVSFALTIKVGNITKASSSATASISFTSSVVTQNISSIAPNRTNPSFTVAVPDGTTLTGNATGGGTWSGPTGPLGQLVVTYAPPSPLPANNQATISYTSPNQKGTVTLTFPHDIQRESSRIDSVSIDFEQEYPGLTIKSVTVTDLSPSQDGSGGTWSLDQMNSLVWDFTPPAGIAAITPLEWDPTTKAYDLAGAPGVKPVQVDTVKKAYTLTFADGSTTSAELTLDFTPTTLAAYGITYLVHSGSGSTVPIAVLDYCYLGGDTLNPPVKRNDPANGTSAGGGTSTAPTYTLTYQNLTRTSPTITFTYEVPVFQPPYTTAMAGPNQTTILTPINVTLSPMGMSVMPKATDYLLAQDVWSANAPRDQVGVDVLSGCSAYYGIDPSTLELTGLLDMGSGWEAPAAFLQPDGKAVRVPEEGSWHVAQDTSDNNAIKIGFVKEQGLVNPPTPIGYRFRDLQGNLSDQGIVMMDTNLSSLDALPSAVKALDDKAFWDYFQQNVIWWVDGNGHPMQADHVVATAMLLAGVTRTLGKVGGNPIDSKALSDAYDGWVQNGKQWHEKWGQEDSKCLFSICRDLVDKNTTGMTLTYRPRHWRLMVMARMMSYTTMLPLIQN